MAILLAKLFGMGVITTCGTDAKCAAALAIGADHAINYRDQDFVAKVAEHTGGRGVDVVLDMVGGDYLPRNLACLAEDGRHVTIAVQGGVRAEINLVQIMLRRLSLSGSTMRARSDTFKALLAQEIEANVWPSVANGELRPVMDRVFPLEQAGLAHARMEKGEHMGKIVLAMGDATQ
jgi:NADPH:quinone reductase-like Zn-dependent oxidoreductase